MSDHHPARVRVTGPKRSSRQMRRTGVREIDSGSRLGDIYITSLLREQRILAAAVLGVLVVSLGIVPLTLVLIPSVNDVTVWGWPLPWVMLVAVLHPHLLLLGWLYVRRAETNERAFAALVDDRGPHDEAAEPRP